MKPKPLWLRNRTGKNFIKEFGKDLEIGSIYCLNCDETLRISKGQRVLFHKECRTIGRKKLRNEKEKRT